MKKDDAAHESPSGIAFRVKDDKLLMFFVSAQAEHMPANGKNVNEGFYTQVHDGKVRRFAGVTIRDTEDWRGCDYGSIPHDIFKARYGPPPGTAGDWTGAIGASPANLAIRTTRDGLLMVRRSKDFTWLESSRMNEIIRLRQGFRHYDGWEPMPADHPLAQVMIDKRYEDRYPYRRAENAPGGIPLDQVDQWVRTGDCEFLKQHRARCEQERVAHNESLAERNRRNTVNIQERKADGGVEMHTLPLRKEINEGVQLIGEANALAERCQLDNPEPEVLKVLGPLAQSLASTAQSMVQIGENETAKDLALTLKYLVGNASWLLRSDRTDFTRRKINDRG